MKNQTNEQRQEKESMLGRIIGFVTESLSFNYVDSQTQYLSPEMKRNFYYTAGKVV